MTSDATTRNSRGAKGSSTSRGSKGGGRLRPGASRRAAKKASSASRTRDALLPRSLQDAPRPTATKCRLYRWVHCLLSRGAREGRKLDLGDLIVILDELPDEWSEHFVHELQKRAHPAQRRMARGEPLRRRLQFILSADPEDDDDIFSHGPNLQALGCQQALIQHVQRLSDWLPEDPEPDPQELRLQELGRLFLLDKLELDVVAWSALYQTNRLLDSLFDLYQHPFNRNTITQRLAILSWLLKVEPGRLGKTLSAGARLRRTGVLDPNLDLTWNLVEFFIGTGSMDLSDEYLKADSGEVLPTDRLAVCREDLDMLRHILRTAKPGQGVNILLHGKAGTGKTELARALARETGRRCCFLASGTQESPGRISSSQKRTQGLHVAENLLESSPHILVVDEADDLLNSGDGLAMRLGLMPRMDVKGDTNDLLDRSSLVRIWIVNFTRMIEESTSRRFDYAVEFLSLSQNQRSQAWETLLERSPDLAAALPPERLEEIASEFPVQAGSMERALRWVDPSEGTESCLRRLRAGLRSQCALVGEKPQMASRANSVQYSVEGLATAGDDLEHVERALRNFVEQRRSRADAAPGDTPFRNLNVLLTGVPGTGKTEFARYLARHLGLPIHVQRTSDLLDCYVGQTEQNIARAFALAARDEALLFIDEADSLLSRRTMAHRQWEVSQVNELLTQMESFEGILVCATNYLEQLDTAALRRFSLKVEFLPLEPSGACLFFDRYLASLAASPMSAHQELELASLKGLVPGDFKVVQQKHALVGARAVPVDELLRELRREIALRQPENSRRMGFTA